MLVCTYTPSKWHIHILHLLLTLDLPNIHTVLLYKPNQRINILFLRRQKMTSRMIDNPLGPITRPYQPQTPSLLHHRVQRANKMHHRRPDLRLVKRPIQLMRRPEPTIADRKLQRRMSQLRERRRIRHPSPFLLRDLKRSPPPRLQQRRHHPCRAPALAEADYSGERSIGLQRRGHLCEPRVDARVLVRVVFAAPPGPGVGFVVVGGGGGGEARDVVVVEFERRGGVDEGEVREGFVQGLFERSGFGVEEGPRLSVACYEGEAC